jgi:hypothetical protein
MESITIVEKLLEVQAEVARARGSEAGPAAREFAIALTHLEDAVMRVNRGFAIQKDGEVTTADVQGGRARGRRDAD